MVEETLNNEKAHLESTVKNEDSSLTSFKASESQLGSNVTNAESALATAKATTVSTAAALEEAKAKEKTCKDFLKKTTDDNKAATDKFEEMKVSKDAIEKAMGEHLQPIEDGEDGKKHFKKFEPFLKQIELESTLLTALPSTCGKAKDKRGSFDVLVLAEFNKALKSKISALGDDIANEGPAAAAREAAAAAAEKDATEATSAKTKASEDFEAAKKEEADRTTALEEAKKAVEEFAPKLEERTKALADAKTALAEFESGPFTGFANLKNKVAAIPEEPAPAEEAAPEEPAAAEAPAAEEPAA